MLDQLLNGSAQIVMNSIMALQDNPIIAPVLIMAILFVVLIGKVISQLRA